MEPVDTTVPAQETETREARVATDVERLTYNRAEVEHALGISTTTVWRLEKLGVIQPLLGLGRHKLYSVAAIRRLAEKGVDRT
jgi:hypothetical protein